MRIEAGCIGALAGLAVGSGCLADSLAKDAQAVLVVWTYDADTTLGCTPDGADDQPLVRIRSHVQGVDDDDEWFDWVPCFLADPTEVLPPQHGVTAPLDLGTYDVSLEMWDAARSRRIARSTAVRTAFLNNNPVGPFRVDLVLAPEATFTLEPPDTEAASTGP